MKTTSGTDSSATQHPTTHVPLSPAQHGMWVTEHMLRAGSAHHLAVTVRLTGPLDVAALTAACERFTARHPLLGARLDPREPALAHPGRAVTPDVRPCPPDGLDAALHEETVRPFDLTAGPLVRFTLLTVGPEHHVLHTVAHHLVFDGNSKDVLVAELAAAYRSEGIPGPVGPPEGSVAGPDEVAVTAAADFWSPRWHEPAAPVLPGLPASVRDITAPAPGAAVPFALEARQHARLRAVAESLGVTRFELLLALWHTLLLRYGDPSPVTALELSTRSPQDSGRTGLYVNELPVFTRPRAHLPFVEFVREVRAELRALYAHRTVPLGRAVRGLTPRTALTPLSIGYRRRTGEAEPDFGEALTAEVEWTGFTHTVRNLVHLQLVDGEHRLDGSLQYRADAFAPGAPARIVAHFGALVEAALTAPETALADLTLFSGDEHAHGAGAEHTTAPACPPDATVMGMFAAQAAASPDAVAVVDVDGRRTGYRQLYTAVVGFAERVRALGLGAGDLVGVELPRCTEQLVAVLGVLAAGAAYVPLDPEYPAERLDFVRTDAGLRALVTDGPAPDGLPVLAPGPLPDAESSPLPAPPASAPRPGDPAYVIYTSGSTGTPKGVEVPHGALANLIAAMGRRAGADAGDRWLGLTSLSFDISTVELLLPLTTGARTVLVPEGAQRDGAALLKLVDAHGITHLQATPNSWRLMLDAGLHRPGLVAVAGGEALPGPLAEELISASGRLINVYGPTETTVWSTLAALVPGEPVSIGSPLDATSAHVLDPHGQPVPAGLTGELYLGGAGVAHGYRGRPGLTAQCFVPDPYGPPGSRLYRTGDLVRRLPDGRLEFAGRTDSQVKLRGHRIELGEIEARLDEHPQVRQAAVVLRTDPGTQARLVAYTVPAGEDGDAPSPQELRAHLARTLPAAMLPTAWLSLAAFPLTPNGKLDRARLPEPPRTRGSESAEDNIPKATGPLDGAAGVVRDIWQEVLRLDDIGPDEDLFDLGGHSLTITAIAVRIRKRLGVDVPLDVFFDTPTISGVADAVAELQQEEDR